jgi:hypothetical protein
LISEILLQVFHPKKGKAGRTHRDKANNNGQIMLGEVEGWIHVDHIFYFLYD